MNVMIKRLSLLLCVLISLSACAGGQEVVASPDRQTDPAPSNESETAAPEDAPAHNEVAEASSAEPNSEPFPEGDAVCQARGFSCPEEQVCSLGDQMEPFCIPVLTAKDVELPVNFSKVVIIEDPQIVTFPRRRICKARTCSMPGAALQLDGGRVAHFRSPRSKETPFGSDLICFQRKCPGRDAKRLLGVILPYYDTEGAPPHLEIEVLRFDPEVQSDSEE